MITVFIQHEDEEELQAASELAERMRNVLKPEEKQEIEVIVEDMEGN